MAYNPVTDLSSPADIWGIGVNSRGISPPRENLPTPPVPPAEAPDPTAEKPAPPALPAELRGVFEDAAIRHDVPVNVLMALAETGSAYNPRATSGKGASRARGIMQITDTAALPNRVNSYDANQSID